MAARSADRYFELKSEIHRKLIGVLNLERVSSIPKDRIRSEIGRVVARLPDGSRVNAIIPPLALDGPCMSIRRFGRHVITQDEMVEYKTIMPGMLKFLAACCQAKCTILISGGTGSGKTTMLNALSRFIPEEER